MKEIAMTEECYDENFHLKPGSGAQSYIQNELSVNFCFQGGRIGLQITFLWAIPGLF